MRTTYRLAASYAVFLATACFIVAWTGVVRIALTPMFAWAVALMALGVAFGFDRWTRRALPRSPRLGMPAQASRRTAVAWGIAVAATAAYALLWVPAYFRPDVSYDGLTYHVPTIHHWALKGYVHWIPAAPEGSEFWQFRTDALLNGYPKTGEVVGFLLARLSGGNLVNALNLAFVPLASLAIAAMAEELGASRAPALAAGALFALVPTNVGQAATTYVDTAFACAVIAFVAFLFLAFRFLLNTPDARIPRPVLVASGAALGLALGIKGPALALAALAVLALAVGTGVRLRRVKRRRGERALGTALAVTLMIGVAVPVGGFWYLRNAVVRHNPMHPFEITLAGKVVFPGTPVKEMISEEPNTPAYMRSWGKGRRLLHAWGQSGRLEWPIDAVIEHDERGYALDVREAHDPAWPRSIRYQDARSGGLGFLWLLAGIPSIVALLTLAIRSVRRGTRAQRLRRRRDLGALVGMLVVTGTFFLMTPMAWWARYTLWLHGAGLAAFGVVLHELLHRSGRSRALTVGAAPILVGVLGISFFEYAYSVKWSHTAPYFIGPVPVNRHSSIREIGQALTTMKEGGVSAIYVDLMENEIAREALSGEGVVAVAPVSLGIEMVLGQLSMPVGRRTWIMVGQEIGTDPDAAREFVERHLPRWIVWDVEMNGDAPVLERTATRAAWLRSMRIYEFGERSSAAVLTPPK